MQVMVAVVGKKSRCGSCLRDGLDAGGDSWGLSVCCGGSDSARTFGTEVFRELSLWHGLTS